MNSHCLKLRSVICGVVLSVVACQADNRAATLEGEPDAGFPPTISTFTASPQSLPLGGGPVTLEWSVSGATTITLDQGVGAVSSTSTTVHPIASTTWTLTAANALGSVTKTASVTVATTQTVSGRLVTLKGQPVPARQIVIVGHAPVNTDSQGAFAIPDVSVPYDIMWIDSTNKAATLYKGLTRADPMLLNPEEAFGAMRSATLTGSITGGSTTAAGYVAFGSQEATAGVTLSGSTFAMDGSDADHAKVTWYGPTTTTGRLIALQFVDDSVTALPESFPGYGESSELVLEDGHSYPVDSIQLSPAPTQSLSGTVRIPDGYSMMQIGACLNVSGFPFALTLIDQPSMSGAFNYLVPALPGVSVMLFAKAGLTDTGTTTTFNPIAPGGATTELVVHIAETPAYILPVNAARGLDATTASFSWQRFSPFNGDTAGKGVHFVSFLPYTAGNPTIRVITEETSTTIPDLSAYGLGLPHSASYAWYVNGYGAVGDMDEFASEWALRFYNIYPTAQSSYGETPGRTFVTQ